VKQCSAFTCFVSQIEARAARSEENAQQAGRNDASCGGISESFFLIRSMASTYQLLLLLLTFFLFFAVILSRVGG